MSTISFDSQSFIVDGKRVWLVSGAIHYPRVPRELWRNRIRAAKQAGLNCIETYVFWNIHEPRPGVFDFLGQNDLRAFVQIIAEEGMYCIIRPGPYVCAEWDFGGLPAWLFRSDDEEMLQIEKPNSLKLREATPAFLTACARYFGAVMDQVRDLQITAPHRSNAAAGIVGNTGGPIILMQAENEWFCHNPEQADDYLKELVRYLRENGCTVPINNCNNLWQAIDGTFNTWNGSGNLAADMRQVRTVQPNAPRVVTEYWPGWFDQWGEEHNTNVDAALNEHRLVQILATGAQYNLYMFHGGTNFGFTGGRTVANPACFMTTSYDYDAPLSEAGWRGAKYDSTKRVSVFANQFANVLANLQSTPPHAAILPGEKADETSMIHLPGTQGDVVYILRGAKATGDSLPVLLPSGESMIVPMGTDRVAWFLLNANLSGVATLTSTNLRPWAFVGKKMLVLFGPAGATGQVTIDDAKLIVTVPKDNEPLVQHHEGLTLVVLNSQQIDATYITPTGIVIGASGLDENDQPQPRDGWKKMCVVDLDGEVKSITNKPAAPLKNPSLKDWQQLLPAELEDENHAGFAAISGPLSHEQLGNDFGYGWYRIKLAKPATGKAVLAPGSGHRLAIFADGKFSAIIGHGPGAENAPQKIALGKSNVILADNLGRFNYGWHVGEKTGLFEHVFDVTPIKLGKPSVIESKTPDAFALRGFWNMLRRGESRQASTLVWKFKTTGKMPVILDISDLPARVMILLNDQPVDLYDRGQSAHFWRALLNEKCGLKHGNNELKLASFGAWDAKVDATKFVTLYQATANLTHGAQWSFAKWSVPDAAAFDGAAGEKKKSSLKPTAGKPCWYRTQFDATTKNIPLWLEPIGLSKGQIFFNGHNVGRYFVATDAGKKVPPQTRYYLPQCWIKTDGPNEVLIFDEHGKNPGKCRLVFDATGPYRRD